METKADQLPTAPLIERFQGGIRANADPRMLAERLLRASELALEAARRDTGDAMLACEELSERILALEAELAQARQEPEQIQGLLAAERRARRLAEQQAYAERARREELQQELAAERELDQTDPARDDRIEAEARRRELESEAAGLRRRADELGYLLGTARRGRERAERRVAVLTAALDEAQAHLQAQARAGGPDVAAGPGPGLGPIVLDGLAREFAVAAEPVLPSLPAAPGPLSLGPDRELALERTIVRARSHEARAAQLERELSEQISRSSRAYDAIEELRLRLGAIGGWNPGPSEREPTAVPEPSAGEPEPSVAEADPRPPAPAVVVEPERFNAALSRLREAVPASESARPDPVTPTGPGAWPPEPAPGPTIAWLPGVFRRLAREDAAAAGQLVLELLPAQRTVHPEPIAYDLELPGQTCIQLTAGEEGLKLELGERRPPSQVRFALTGEPTSLGRLLAAGRIGRRLRRGLPKLTGDRRGLEALDALVHAPLSLRRLHDVGVRLEARLALEVVARMIDPGWTRGSRFAIGYRAPSDEPRVYLEVTDGGSAKVSDAVAPTLVAGTIACDPEALLVLLDGGEPGEYEFDGEAARLAEVVGWVKRAQSG